MRTTSRRMGLAFFASLLLVGALLPAASLAGSAPSARERAAAAQLARLRSIPAGAASATSATRSVPAAGQDGLDLGQIERFRCRTAGNPAASVDISCNARTLGQNFGPDNEIAIAVDPEDPDHLLAGSNDYFYQFTAEARLAVVPTGFFTSFDGGRHWIDGQVPFGRGNQAGDPSPAFDAKHDVALMASLDFQRPPEGGETSNGHVVVSRSTDGGRTFSEPVRVMTGIGADSSPTQVFWDKEWLTVDNHPRSPHYGRAYVTASRFFGGNEYQESPIYLSYSDDGGRSWSPPRRISGSHPTCTFQTAGAANQCDEDQFSIPEVAPDGTVYVHFANNQNEAEWETILDFDSQIMVTRSSNGGRTFAAPVPAVQIEDGLSDMPFNIQFRQTIWGHQFRWIAPGTISVNPRHGDELTVVFADRGAPNPNATDECVIAYLEQGPQPPRYDPCNAGPGSDTDVYKVVSTDGGRTWSPRRTVGGAASSAWFPWADHGPDGSLAVAWDEDTRPAPADTFNHVLWTKDGGRQVLAPPAGRSRYENPDVAVTHWAGQYLTDPSQWPRICGPRGYRDPPVGDARGKDCSVFIGDYTGLAVGSDGSANVVWTGLNRFVTSPQIDPYTGRRHDGYASDAMFARR
jgi:BNR/Asp-box repeat